ncbi:MAG: bacillithiol biosynthesis cysteine-adding enzyme BshC [Bacteroidia bacterium]|nr:bacillithiol biosynthesis cysteine-adding enzyme BshC [Bacteroidia bacterium]
MIYSKIPLSESGLISPLVLDYLAGNDNLRTFYNQPHSLVGYEALIKEKQFDAIKRNLLIKVFNEQYKKAGISLNSYPEIDTNIKLLSDPKTYTITTGHQLCLYGGPLFLTYKVLTTIKLCSELKRAYPENNFVPVLWLASEDHDFEEINNIYLFGKDIKWYKNSHHMPVGRLDLDGMKEDIESIEKLIGTNETGKKWINLIEDTYLKSNNLSEASIKIFTALFREFGLLVLDPDQREFKEEFSAVMKLDILDQNNYKVQLETDKILTDKYKLQINAREINFFYLHTTLGRKLIKKEGNGFHLVDSEVRFTFEEMEEEIKNFPENFSPNVNLRPLYQETILPNLAYVGGPAEVAYWLQLKSVFDANGIQFPAVVLRSVNLLTGTNLTEKIEKTGLKVSDLIGSEEKLTQTYLKNVSNFAFQKSFNVILNEFQILIDTSRNVNKEVSKKLLETKLSLKDFFNQYHKDLKRSVENSEAEQIEKIIKLRGKIYPKNTFQERIDTLLQHEVTCNRDLKMEILEQMEIFNPQLTIISI